MVSQALQCTWAAYRKLVCLIGLWSETVAFASEPLRLTVSKWPRVPSPAVFSTNIVRIARTRKDKRVRCLASLSSPSCGISLVSATFCFLNLKCVGDPLSGMCHHFCLPVVCSKTDVDLAYRIKQGVL